ncbi:MAG: AAA family ATPase [Candidatus Kerfeldbacteria bacterium]|nr:AAA family ATPase [Candidatus Kerfeldbacteria bacterium]
MDEYKNPFAPGAGTPPPALVGRTEILNNVQLALHRVKAGKPAKSLLLVGLRGVGKTVLLNKIEEIAIEDGYKTTLLEAPENKSLPSLLVPVLRQHLLSLDRGEKVNEQVKKALRVLKSFVNAIKLKHKDVEIQLDIDPELGTADSGDIETDLPQLLLAVAQAAYSRKISIALIIDEMQYINEVELSALIMAVHKINQKQLPFILIGAGLPQLVGLTGKSKSYAERLFDFPNVGPLTKEDAKIALQNPAKQEGVEFEDKALNDIIDITQGYPYFLQEWGYHTWNLATSSPISKKIVHDVEPIVTKKLDENFFRVRFDRLTPREKEYLRATAELGAGQHRSGDIAELMGIRVQSAAPLRSGLIHKGMIYSPSHGDTAFTVPLFEEYMKRVMPKWKSKIKNGS